MQYKSMRSWLKTFIKQIKQTNQPFNLKDTMQIYIKINIIILYFIE